MPSKHANQMLACSLPIVVRRFPGLQIPRYFLFISRHFGTGVLIATAFVHLLPTAFVSLTDPCLPAFWNEGYPAMAGLIAMTAVLVVVGIEMFFATRGAGHMHGSEYDSQSIGNGHAGYNRQRANGGADPKNQRRLSYLYRPRARHGEQASDSASAAYSGSTEHLVWGKEPATSPMASPVPRPIHENDDVDLQANDSDLDLDELDPIAQTASVSSHSPYQPTTAAASPSQQKLLLQVFLLEAGILFHSVFIGIALSIATGTPFVVLLIAISFHQTFEGLALGSRIAAISTLSPSSPKPWLMALAYGTTTPVGQAIGLAVHGLYDPQGQVGLLMVGATNAVSSGLLLFAGLVELLAEDFLSDTSYKSLRGRKRLEACGAVVGGAMLMAVVGAWA